MAKICKFSIFVCAMLGSLLMYLAFVVVTKEKPMMIRAPPEVRHSHKSTDTSRNTQITLLLRMPGKIMDHRARYYCDLFRRLSSFGHHHMERQ